MQFLHEFYVQLKNYSESFVLNSCTRNKEATITCKNYSFKLGENENLNRVEKEGGSVYRRILRFVILK